MNDPRNIKVVLITGIAGPGGSYLAEHIVNHCPEVAKQNTLQIPDVSRFTRVTGWKPRYSFEVSVRHLLEYWREKIRARE